MAAGEWKDCIMEMIEQWVEHKVTCLPRWWVAVMGGDGWRWRVAVVSVLGR